MFSSAFGVLPRLWHILMRRGSLAESIIQCLAQRQHDQNPDGVGRQLVVEAWAAYDNDGIICLSFLARAQEHHW